MPVRHLLGALDGGLKGDSPGDFWVLGSYVSKQVPIIQSGPRSLGQGGPVMTRSGLWSISSTVAHETPIAQHAGDEKGSKPTLHAHFGSPALQSPSR